MLSTNSSTLTSTGIMKPQSKWNQEEMNEGSQPTRRMIEIRNGKTFFVPPETKNKADIVLATHTTNTSELTKQF